MDNMLKRSLWILCPVCGAKTRTKVYDKTIIYNFPLYCPKCKKESLVNVEKLRITLNQVPNI